MWHKKGEGAIYFLAVGTERRDFDLGLRIIY